MIAAIAALFGFGGIADGRPHRASAVRQLPGPGFVLAVLGLTVSETPPRRP